MEIKKILLVDDDKYMRMLAVTVLENEWVVATAASGAEALDKAAGERPDLILLDMLMPEMDGRATLIRLRERPATAGIPVVFLTGSVKPDDLESYRKLGAAGVIKKPFAPDTLSEQVHRIAASLSV